MSGCDVAIELKLEQAFAKALRAEYVDWDIQPDTDLGVAPKDVPMGVLGCDCDHGEDDPCCTETETPESDRPRDDL